MLDYNPDAPGDDLQSLSANGPSLSFDDHNRSFYFINSQRLLHWVSARRSAALFVHGESDSGQSRMSALGFAGARLAAELEMIRSPAVVPLYFFCSRHASREKSWETPAGVLNSLLEQLLTRCGALDLTDTLNLGNFDPGSVSDVFDRFASALLRVQPGTTVFCVVDDLSVYLDSREASGEAKRLVRRLLSLVRSRRRKMPYRFKLLLTVANRLHSSVVQGMRDIEILILPCSLPNAGEYNLLKWDKVIARQLECLTEPK